MSLFVVDKAGRKPLLIGSGVVMSISMASMGVAFYLNSIGNNQFGYTYLIKFTICNYDYNFLFQLSSIG